MRLVLANVGATKEHAPPVNNVCVGSQHSLSAGTTVVHCGVGSRVFPSDKIRRRALGFELVKFRVSLLCLLFFS